MYIYTLYHILFKHIYENIHMFSFTLNQYTYALILFYGINAAILWK